MPCPSLSPLATSAAAHPSQSYAISPSPLSRTAAGASTLSPLLPLALVLCREKQARALENENWIMFPLCASLHGFLLYSKWKGITSCSQGPQKQSLSHQAPAPPFSPLLPSLSLHLSPSLRCQLRVFTQSLSSAGNLLLFISQTKHHYSYVPCLPNSLSPLLFLSS